jgi:hypothetical protein
MNFDSKRVPTWSQHLWKNASKINAKAGSEKDEENHERTCFSDV